MGVVEIAIVGGFIVVMWEHSVVVYLLLRTVQYDGVYFRGAFLVQRGDTVKKLSNTSNRLVKPGKLSPNPTPPLPFQRPLNHIIKP